MDMDAQTGATAEQANTSPAGVTTTRKRAQSVEDWDMFHRYFRQLVDREMGGKTGRVALQNPRQNSSLTFTQYTKDLIKQYIANPANNLAQIRSVSQFLMRVSMLYREVLTYFPHIPTWNYTVTNEMDFVNPQTADEMISKYQDCLRFLHGIDMQKECSTVVELALRDGMYVGYANQMEKNKFFLQPLNPRYCKIMGKNSDGQWVVYFDATFFTQGTNRQFVEGLTGEEDETTGLWASVFREGYEAYQRDQQNNRWFMLPPEKTLCVLAGLDDEFDVPLPYFLPLFTSLLDLLDLEQIIMSKNELENYKLLVSKIPLLSGSDEVDDFAVSLDLAERFNQLLEMVVPSQVGTAYSPFEVEPIQFERSNTSDETDKLQRAMNNLFSNAGISELVVAGGASTNSVGLKHSIQHDETTAFIYMDRIQSWLRYFLKSNGYDKVIFTFHRQSYFNKDEYVAGKKDAATLGGSAMDYCTALGMTPYEAYNKILTEKALDIKSMMIPLQSSYNMGAQQATTSMGGAPTKDEDDLSEEGLDTREAGKNEGTRAQE